MKHFLEYDPNNWGDMSSSSEDEKKNELYFDYDKEIQENAPIYNSLTEEVVDISIKGTFRDNKWKRSVPTPVKRTNKKSHFNKNKIKLTKLQNIKKEQIKKDNKKDNSIIKNKSMSWVDIVKDMKQQN